MISPQIGSFIRLGYAPCCKKCKFRSGNYKFFCNKIVNGKFPKIRDIMIDAEKPWIIVCKHFRSIED